ncbi:MopE-related protein [Pyxidicoccus xibeiensis]|uniref:MopE-related protein n=1 Tax=Pyxidicoccus xibeiensis TaxID=2906759 RepID=UPI0020A71E76|nr:MopE-related protein [Pyxidicoccus xibeiensis]MCP3139765.1 hypothetical protein [Pyxidicoccus xibeiensis]
MNASTFRLIVLVAAALMLPACKDWIDINDQDRDKILAQLDKSTNELSGSVNGLSETFARERGKLSQELQQTLALSIANLNELVAQLDRSADKMRVSVTNFQQDTGSNLQGSITRLQGTIATLQNNLTADGAATILLTTKQLEEQREQLLKQTHATVQSVIRPTLERLSRVGDDLVGKVTLTVNVVIVRVVTGLLAAIALIGAVLAFLKLEASARRWPAVAFTTVIVAGSGLSATVLAEPIALIGAPNHQIPTGTAVCANMTQASLRFREAAPSGRRGKPANLPDADERAFKLKDLSVECEIFAPTGALGQQAKDAFVVASLYFDDRIPCVTDADCLAGAADLRCDPVSNVCVLSPTICKGPAECPAGNQCVSHRCVPITGPTAACTTPHDCRPEQSCDRATGRCLVTADVPPTSCDVDPKQLGPCSRGVLGSKDRWVVCKQTVERQLEACNGIDDDCDGTPDQGLASAEPCIAEGQVGYCRDGVKTCAGAAGWQCQPRSRRDEVAQGCNNVDDDCDGTVDNGVTLGGSCSAGVGDCARRATQQCVNGATLCVPGQPLTEVCGNGADDDCDGATDGADSNLAGIPESCNGVDDNCNGAVDDGIFCRPVKLVMSDVDDETYLWFGDSTDKNNAICGVRRSGNSNGAGECDLVASLQQRGIGVGKHRFTIMTVNSGCFGTSSHAQVVTDVETETVHRQGRVTAHCGWVEKDQFEVDFTTGEVFPVQNWGCVNDGNCRP